MQELQRNDSYCRDIAKKLHKDVELQKIFIKEKGVLHRLWIEDGRTFKCILVPKVLQDSMVILAHVTVDTMGQEGHTVASNDNTIGKACGNRFSDIARNVHNAYYRTKAKQRQDLVTLSHQIYQWNSSAWT